MAVQSLPSPTSTQPAVRQCEQAHVHDKMTGDSLRNLSILFILLFSLFLAALDFSIITTAIPSISHQLHLGTAYIWIGSAYLLASAAVVPSYGRVGDILGRKSTLLGAIMLFAIGSAVSGWSHTAAQLIVGRAIQGCGAGGIIVLVNICISDISTARRRSLFLSMTGLVWALAAGLGPLLGGLFTQFSTWRWIFWINIPCSFVAFAVLCVGLRTGPTHSAIAGGKRTMDWFGTAMFIGMTIMILLGLDFGGVVFPWNSAKVYALIVSGCFLFFTFIIWEFKGASDPLVPGRLINSKCKAAPLLVCFTHGFVNVSSWYFLPFYFQSVRGVSPTRSGVFLMPIVVVQAVVGVIVGGIIHRFGWIHQVIWVGMGFMTLGMGLLISLNSSTALAIICVIEIVTGIGVGAVFQAPLVAYQIAVEPSDMASATALFGFVRSLSTSISVVLGGVVFQNSMNKQSDRLVAFLGRTTAQDFSAANAASNALAVNMLPLIQQLVVKEAFNSSLRSLWIMYASIGALGIIAAFFVTKHHDSTLSRVSAPHDIGFEQLQRLGNGDKAIHLKADSSHQTLVGDVQRMHDLKNDIT